MEVVEIWRNRAQKRVLIVGDEKTFREALREFVESLGYSCTEADSAHSALGLLRKKRFPIVVSDLVMPEMDRLELIRTIKKSHSAVDVLIIMGRESKYPPIKILQAGASDFLVKPLNMDDLAAKLYKIEKEKALKQRLHLSSVTDELTGLYNRRLFYQRLNREIQKAREQGHSLSLIMVDVDGFKGFNDRYGHLKGDDLLETVARVLRLSIREHIDCAFRYGGDEFVVILPEADGRTAQFIGNRIKTGFENTAPGGLTLSMRIAEFQEDFDIEAFVHLVDKRMHKDEKMSKELGQPQLEVCREKNQNIAPNPPNELSYPAIERRKSPRIKIEKTFVCDGFQATILNISQGGIQIKTKASVPVGKILKMAFSLGSSIVSLVGSVIYRLPLSDGHSLMGLKFTEVSKKDSTLLNRFLDSHLTQNA
jgi:diguanylate cyclase (GGDEF)-like protein